MPAGIVKTKEDEKAWDDAKEIVREQYPGREQSDPDSFYALVTTVFKSIQKGRKKKASMEGVSDDIDWRAASSFLAPVYEDDLSIRTEATKLEVGSQVAVTTKLGRSMDSGVVTDANDKQVTIRVSRDGVDQDRTYSTDLYNFFVKSTDESDVLGESVLKTAAYDKDFKAGFAKGQEVVKKNPRASSTDGVTHYRKVSKKHGSYWLDGFNAAIDMARGATATANAKVAAKMGLAEATDVEIVRDVPDDPETSDSTGPLPVRPPPESESRVGVEYVMTATGGDRRYAEEVWQDILSLGFKRAMQRHDVAATVRQPLENVLVGLGFINQEAPMFLSRGPQSTIG